MRYLLLVFVIYGSLFSKTINRSNTLNLKIERVKGGIIFQVNSDRGTPILKPSSLLFDAQFLNLKNRRFSNINSNHGWNRVHIEKGKREYQIFFEAPKSKNLPPQLKIIYTISLHGKNSSWKIKIINIGENHSLVSLKTPSLKMPLLSHGKLLVPKYSGKLIDVSKNQINYNMLYPAGWKSTMQFFAYYNDKIGIYLASHDPKASTKKFVLKKENREITYLTKIIVPNKTLPNNNFTQSGEFELDLFRGDWYDASLIYKKWAKDSALYWPRLTQRKRAKEHLIGDIALWGACVPGAKRDIKKIDRWMREFRKEFKDIGVGIMWLEWNKIKHDYDFPKFFPAKDGMRELVQKMQNRYHVYIMPYINARLYDMDLPHFKRDAYPYAVKNSHGEIFSYAPLGKKGDTFAIMDPTQKRWQNIIVDASKKLLIDFSTKGLYLDQITASSPKEDMDQNHIKQHPLAGGSWWRDGYEKMLQRIDKVAGDNHFLTSEGANEFLSNHIDGFYLHGWCIDGLVPAYQVVYGGRVQLFGIPYQTNEYDKDSFYTKTAKAFTTGIELGPLPVSWFVQSPKAKREALPYIKDIATLRYKLREFLSYGERLRDLILRGDIPKIESKWFDYGRYHGVTIKSVQSGVYRSEDRKKIALIFSNASRDSSVRFSFDFNAKRYNLTKDIEIAVVTSKGEGEYKKISPNFKKKIEIKPLQSFAYIIRAR